MAAMCIANPLSEKNAKSSFFSTISGLYATHPPISERIKALEAMDGKRL
jgi:Zn-dependent protease with chaperone function